MCQNVNRVDSRIDEIVQGNKLTKNNMRGVYDYVLTGMHYGKPKEIGDKYYSDPWLSSEGRYGDNIFSLFYVAKCTSSNKHPSIDKCASEEEINLFVDNIHVTSNNFQNFVDWTKRGVGVEPLS